MARDRVDSASVSGWSVSLASVSARDQGEKQKRIVASFLPKRGENVVRHLFGLCPVSPYTLARSRNVQRWL